MFVRGRRGSVTSGTLAGMAARRRVLLVPVALVVTTAALAVACGPGASGGDAGGEVVDVAPAICPAGGPNCFAVQEFDPDGGAPPVEVFERLPDGTRRDYPMCRVIPEPCNVA